METETQLRRSGPIHVTPEKILQFIDSIYGKWTQIDAGLNEIVSDACLIINSSSLFSAIRIKSPQILDIPQYKYAEFIDCIHIEFKGTSKLYALLKCDISAISTSAQFSMANRIIHDNLEVNILNLINLKLKRYYPKINSEDSYKRFESMVRTYISHKIICVTDIESRRFILVIKK